MTFSTKSQSRFCCCLNKSGSVAELSKISVMDDLYIEDESILSETNKDIFERKPIRKSVLSIQKATAGLVCILVGSIIGLALCKETIPWLSRDSIVNTQSESQSPSSTKNSLILPKPSSVPSSELATHITPLSYGTHTTATSEDIFSPSPSSSKDRDDDVDRYTFATLLQPSTIEPTSTGSSYNLERYEDEISHVSSNIPTFSNYIQHVFSPSPSPVSYSTEKIPLQQSHHQIPKRKPADAFIIPPTTISAVTSVNKPNDNQSNSSSVILLSNQTSHTDINHSLERRNVCLVYQVETLLLDTSNTVKAELNSTIAYECEPMVFTFHQQQGEQLRNSEDSLAPVPLEVQSFRLPDGLITPQLILLNENLLHNRQWYIEYDPTWQQNHGLDPTLRIMTPSMQPSELNVPKTVLPEVILRYQKDTQIHQQQNSPKTNQSNKRYLQRDSRFIQPWKDSLFQSLRTNDVLLNRNQDGINTNRTGKVIMIRVNALDVDVDVTDNNLYRLVLGDRNNNKTSELVSLKQQYADCSQGIVNLIPYENVNIPPSGVLTVYVTNDADTYTYSSIFSEANALVLQELGIAGSGMSLGDFVEHAIYIIPKAVQPPDGSLEGILQVSMSGLDSYMSVVSDFWINNESIDENSPSLVVLLKSTGHNRGLGNAWENGDMLGDTTGAMGSPTVGVSKVCFNGIMFEYLQWMLDRTIRFDPFLCPDRRIDLVPFTNYNLSFPGQAVNIRLGEYSLIYNRKQLFNSDTPKYADTVLVHQRVRYVPNAVTTDLRAVLDANNTFYTYLDGAIDIVMEVCSFNDGIPELGLPSSVTLAFGIGALPCDTALYQDGDDCNLNPLTLAPTQENSPSVIPSSSPVTSTPSKIIPTLNPQGSIPTAFATASPTTETKFPSSVPIWITPKYDLDLNNIDYNFWKCEDFQNVLFFFDENFGFQRCTWLTLNLDETYQNSTIKDTFCVRTHLAYYFCEETCEQCTSDCVDDPNGIITYIDTEYTCEWLSTKSYLWTILCNKDDVKSACPGTCKACD